MGYGSCSLPCADSRCSNPNLGICTDPAASFYSMLVISFKSGRCAGRSTTSIPGPIGWTLRRESGKTYEYCY
jgi:hypothetical protein